MKLYIRCSSDELVYDWRELSAGREADGVVNGD